jgi:CheY-like chemotaxis protein
MIAKRALIVDDSKSARLFLSRILEKYELDVDTTETAELAIEYLTNQRPDVIFMDHLMPGMDGFQALQAIKNNPRTATIPIMMYTSQEGELYLGQARALGAVGVLPKQIKQADVSKVLYQLHLVQDRRTTAQMSFQPVNLEPLDEPAAPAVTPASQTPLSDAALREQVAELRQALNASIDHQFERLSTELRALLNDALPAPQMLRGALEARSWGWAVAGVAVAAALVATALWRHEVNLHEAVPSPVLAAPHAAAPKKAPVVASAVSVAPGAAPAEAQAPPLIEPVPYSEDALAGARLEKVSQLLDRLAAENYAGVVDVKAFAGRYCLVGNAADGYSPAPEELPFTKCDLIGNPRETTPQTAQRSLPFANLLGEIRHKTHGALNVELTLGDAAATVAPYPQVSSDLTAGQWNRAASANNRIEIRVH